MLHLYLFSTAVFMLTALLNLLTICFYSYLFLQLSSLQNLATSGVFLKPIFVYPWLVSFKCKRKEKKLSIQST